MENDKAAAWLTLADADAVEQKVVDVIQKLLNGDSYESRQNLNDLGARLGQSYPLQSSIASYMQQHINNMVRDGIMQNFRVDHFYESWNRTAGYRIRYGDHIIQQEQIKMGF